MNTNPTVSRFVDRTNINTPPNTLAKADEEGDSYKYTCISRGHYACDSGDAIHIIIEKDGEIGGSCGDMTHRCTGTNVCKHITMFLKLAVPPQIPASSELIKKLQIMGWVGGKDDLHPAELLRHPQRAEPDVEEGENSAETVHYECPKCGDAIDIEADKLQDWKLNHIDICQGKKAPKEQPKPRPAPSVPEEPEIHPDEDSWKPDEDDCDTSEEPLLLSKPHSPPSPEMAPTNLAAALCNMQRIDLLAVTDSNNPFHNAKYADLASVWAAIRKPLTDNGLAVIQTTEPYTDGITVVTTLLHISGEAFTARLSCEVPKSKPDKNGQIKPNVQGLGSTITYLRRYSLAAMVGVAPIDDDGDAAMSR